MSAPNTGQGGAFTAEINRVLRKFELNVDWPDLISNLNKLNKLLASHAKLGYIPSCVALFKRLAQCLHPALPFGVHLKALETYKLCFEILDSAKIGPVLPLLSIGLFPLLCHAAINVKKTVLDLYEKYLLPLGQGLNPALPAFLVGILPALEEQTEFKDRICKLLENVEQATGQLWFFTCLWSCIEATPGVRLSGLEYFLTRYDRKLALDDQLNLVGSCLDRMVAALCVSAEDDTVLVERAALDVLSTVFPLHTRQLPDQEIIRLLHAVLFCLLRRDMSINRRLYTWLLGESTIPNGEINTDYFLQYGHKLVVSTIEEKLDNNDVEASIKVVRMLTHFMESDEVGRLILNDIMVALLLRCRALRSTIELKLCLQQLFNGLDPGYVWNFLAKKILEASASDRLDNSDQSQKDIHWIQLCELTCFCLEYCSLESDSSIRRHHIPALLLNVFQAMWSCRKRLSTEATVASLHTAECLLNAIQFSPAMTEMLPNANGDVVNCSLDIVVIQAADILFTVLPELLCQRDVVAQTCKLLVAFADASLYCKPHDLLPNDQSVDLVPVPPWFRSLQQCCLTDDFEIVRIACDTLMHVQMLSASVADQVQALAEVNKQQVCMAQKNQDSCSAFLVRPLLHPSQLKTVLADRNFIEAVFERLWPVMSDLRSSFCAEACRLFALMHSLDPVEVGSSAEFFLVSRMTAESQVDRLQSCQTFAHLWVLLRSWSSFVGHGVLAKPFHRALMVMIGFLGTSGPVGNVCDIWWQDCLKHQDCARVVETLLVLLMHPSTERLSISHAEVLKVPCSCLSDMSANSNLIYCIRPHSNNDSCYYHLPISTGAQFRNCNFTDETWVKVRSNVVWAEGGQLEETLSNMEADENSSEAEQGVDVLYGTAVESEILDLMEDLLMRVVDAVVDGKTAAKSGDVKLARRVESNLSTVSDHDDSAVVTSPSSSFAYSAPLLMYTRRFDVQRALHLFDCVRHLLRNGPTLASSLLTTNVNALKSTHFQVLLARHQQALSGKNFWDTSINEAGKNSILLSILVTVCQYYLRSYFLCNPDWLVTEQDIEDNLQVKESCANLLTELLHALGQVLSNADKATALYVHNQLQQCKLQRISLQLLSHSILEQCPTSISGFVGRLAEFNSIQHLNTVVQAALLRLICEQIVLEQQLINVTQLAADGSPVSGLKLQPLVGQRLFLQTVLAGLAFEETALYMCRCRHWFRFVDDALPVFGRALPSLALHLTGQLCRNVDDACSMGVVRTSEYLLNVLETLTGVMRYCVLDPVLRSNTESNVSSPGMVGAKSSGGEIFGGIFRVFQFADHPDIASNRSRITEIALPLWRLEAQTSLLTALPEVFSTLAHIFEKTEKDSKSGLRRACLDLLSPLAVHHPKHFMSAMSLVWQSRSDADARDRYTNTQLDLALFVLSVPMLPFESLLEAAAKTLKEPVHVKNSGSKISYPVDFFIMQLMHGCIQQQIKIAGSLQSTASGCLRFLAQAHTVSTDPEQQFLVFRIFADFVLYVGTFEDTATARSAQDLCAKLVDTLLTIVNLQLQQSSWLKKNLSLKPNLAGDMQSSTTSLDTAGSFVTTKEFDLSTQAQQLLAERLVPVLDIVYKSEDKDKLQAVLATIWASMLPYLKVRSAQNATNFLACSKLLSELSPFTWSRNVWRRAAMDMLVDSHFFRQDQKGLRLWLTITDNCLTSTQDRTVLSTLIGAPTAASIFTSKEQEYENRILALRRLAFVLLSGQLDQYQSNLKELQEKLVDNLRITGVPHVLSAVFLCFRVLMIRVSPHHLTPLWPIIVTEMVSVLNDLEQQLQPADGKNGVIEDPRTARTHDQWLDLNLSCCKCLATYLLLPRPYLQQFTIYRWNFVDNDPQQLPGRATSSTLPILARLVQLMERKGASNKIVNADVLLKVKQLRQYVQLAPYLKALLRPIDEMRLEQLVSLVDDSVIFELCGGWL